MAARMPELSPPHARARSHGARAALAANQRRRGWPQRPGRALAPGLAAVAGLALGFAGCLQFTTFSCEDAEACNAKSGGVCMSGQCAYPDDGCASGLRYDEFADSAFAGDCVAGGSTSEGSGSSTSTSVGSLDTTLTATSLDSGSSMGAESSSSSGETGEACGGAGESCCADGPACAEGLDCMGLACGCVRQIETGDRHSCAVLVDGTVLCWGANDQGQLGDSLQPFESAPISALAVRPSDPIREVRATNHTCVRSEQGNVRCFGANDSGQVDPALAQPTAPATPAPVNSADHVAAGAAFTCAADGVSMVCWGANGQSQLTGVDAGPGPVSTGTGPVARLEAGAAFGCLLQSGTVSCWGANGQGQLATDPAMTPSLPAPSTMPVADVADIALGRTHTCVLTNTAAISCWGRNDLGQLGDGSGMQQIAPVAVAWPPEAGTPIAIAAGDQHTCAIDDDAALWCWGSNTSGQLMLEPDMGGNDQYTFVPVRIDVGAGVLDVAGGVTHTCVRTDTAQVLCWGTNSAGQIGDGTTNYAFEPQPAAIDCGTQ